MASAGFILAARQLCSDTEINDKIKTVNPANRNIHQLTGVW
jgi:hypothetical protein